jgi:hypothetical protein
METWVKLLIILGVVIVIIGLLIGWHYLDRWNKRKKGTLAHDSVSALLKKFAGVRSFKVLENLTLVTGKKETVTIDRALITFNHVILFQIREENGSIYGGFKDPTWISVKTDKENNTIGKVTFENPVLTAQKGNDAVRRILARNKLGKVQTEFYVVFGDPKTELSIGKNMPVLDSKALKTLLGRSKYSEDGPVDVAAVAELLQNGN